MRTKTALKCIEVLNSIILNPQRALTARIDFVNEHLQNEVIKNEMRKNAIKRSLKRGDRNGSEI